MENYKLILPEHLNHYGFLFGGHLLSWVDESTWIAASRDYPGCKLVTLAMDKVEFRKSVREGSILAIRVERCREGTTSVQYTVNVFRVDSEAGGEEPVFSTHVTLVRVNDEGHKVALPGKHIVEPRASH